GWGLVLSGWFPWALCLRSAGCFPDRAGWTGWLVCWLVCRWVGRVFAGWGVGCRACWWWPCGLLAWSGRGCLPGGGWFGWGGWWPWLPGGLSGLLFEICIVGASIFVWSSCVGHTVDALASGADEGRGRLR